MANDLDKLCFVFERPRCGVSGKMVIGHCPDAARCFQLSA